MGDHGIGLCTELRRLVMIGDGEHVPVVSVPEAAPLRNRLSEELIIEHELSLVAALQLRIVNPVDREFPWTAIGAAIDRAVDWHALTRLESVLLCGLAADDPSRPLRQESILLIFWQLLLPRIYP